MELGKLTFDQACVVFDTVNGWYCATLNMSSAVRKPDSTDLKDIQAAQNEAKEKLREMILNMEI